MSDSNMSPKSIISFKKRSLKNLYPKPLDSLILESEPDETSFTELEKRTLKNAWSVFERERYQLTRGLFLDFLTENESLIEYFRMKNGKINVKTLAMHPFWIVNVFKKLIMVGLQSNGHIDSVLNDCAYCHLMHSVPKKELRLLLFAVKDNYLCALGSVVTPTLVNAFQKLCDIICRVHENQRKNSYVPVEAIKYDC